MRRLILLASIALLAGGLLVAPTLAARSDFCQSHPTHWKCQAPTPTPTPTGRPVMPAGAVWSDTFGGTALDPAKWRRETLFDGQTTTFAKWGAFSSDPRLYQVANSTLTLKALYVGGARPYLAPILSTRDLFSHGYGTFRASIRYDRGHALWPAFWTLGANSAEIDVLEGYPEPADPSFYTVVAHLNSSTQQVYSGHSPGFDTGFHVYEVEWQPSLLIARLDGVEVHRFAMSIPSSGHFLLLNLAVGVWFNNTAPDATTPLNPAMDIDWVGVW